jgi:hypothetical protein
MCTYNLYICVDDDETFVKRKLESLGVRDYHSEIIEHVRNYQNSLKDLEKNIIGLYGWIRMQNGDEFEIDVFRRSNLSPSQLTTNSAEFKDWFVAFTDCVKTPADFAVACSKIQTLLDGNEVSIIDQNNDCRIPYCVLRVAKVHSVEVVNNIRKWDFVSGVETNDNGHMKFL